MNVMATVLGKCDHESMDSMRTVAWPWKEMVHDELKVRS